MGLRLSIRNNHEAGALPEMVPLGSRKEAETQGCPEAVMGGTCNSFLGALDAHLAYGGSWQVRGLVCPD